MVLNFWNLRKIEVWLKSTIRHYIVAKAKIKKHFPSLTCLDINECAINNGNCQDKCLNNQGSYSCGCRAGYRVSVDKRSCEGKTDTLWIVSLLLALKNIKLA